MPADAARAGSSRSTAEDPLVVTLPASVAGDLLVVIARLATTPTFNLPTGWIWLVQNNTADASDDTTSAICKLADGSEGTTLNWDLSATAKGCAVAYRITDAMDPAERVPEVTVGTGSAANADPGVMTMSDLPNDFLSIQALLMDHETATFTAPASYGNTQTANSGTAGAVATNCMMASSSRAIAWATAAENPGAWTSTAATTGWTSVGISIPAPHRRLPGLGFASTAVLMGGIRRAWHRRKSGIFVPDLWTPEGATI